MPDNIIQNVSITGEGNIVVGKGDVIINPLPPAETRLRHDLGILLKNVQTTWIKGVLEKSVYEAALLELGMEMREEAVDNPWRMVMTGPDQPREALPRGRKIKDIFDGANRHLLILGEPGSGKTTTLLQLARDLIAEVDQAFTHPVPFVLSLSTWTNKQQPLDDWLIAELNSKYRLPKKDGQRWLEERRILPLLDGLDEVKAENRAACVEKINQLASDYGLQGLAVCSRVKDYTDLKVRLAFYRAIYLQPLTPEQVDEYLNQAGDKLTSLRATLQADAALRSMAQSPLILNIMSLAYQNTSAEALSNPALDTNEARRRHLFDRYIARMFNRKAGAHSYEDDQTRQRLSWLARNMQRYNQEVFLIEGLQPNWLQARRWQWLYIFSSRLAGGFIFVLGFGAWAWLTGSVDLWWFVEPVLIQCRDLTCFVQYLARFRLDLWWTILWYVKLIVIGLIAGLFVGTIDLLRSESLRKRPANGKSFTFGWSVINIVIISLIGGLLFEPSYFLLVTPSYIQFYGMSFGQVYGLIFAMIFGLLFGLRGSRQSPEIDIETVDALRWFWRKAATGGLIGGIVGLLFGPFDMLWTRYGPSLLRGLSFGLRYGMIFGLMGIILNGLRREIIETKSTPNQGIQLSIRNAISGGLILGLMSGLIFGLSLGSNVGGGLIGGLIVGLIGALWYGGLDIIQHYTLRLILIIQGHTPRNYARFLDYAVDRIFLQKVGGGYRFIHRLLLEHFADMSETPKA